MNPNKTITDRLKYLKQLAENPLSDASKVSKLKKEFDLVDVSNFTSEDWELHNSIFN